MNLLSFKCYSASVTYFNCHYILSNDNRSNINSNNIFDVLAYIIVFFSQKQIFLRIKLVRINSKGFTHIIGLLKIFQASMHPSFYDPSASFNSYQLPDIDRSYVNTP